LVEYTIVKLERKTTKVLRKNAAVKLIIRIFDANRKLKETKVSEMAGRIRETKTRRATYICQVDHLKHRHLDHIYYNSA
jgi:hypothetical protein